MIAMASAKVAAYFGIHLTAERREHRAETAHPPACEMTGIDGIELHMTVEGSGPPLVLLHGAGGNLRDFEPLVPELARGFTVIRFDRPGLGHSQLPRRYRPIWRNAAPSRGAGRGAPAAALRARGRAGRVSGARRSVSRAGLRRGGQPVLRRVHPADLDHRPLPLPVAQGRRIRPQPRRGGRAPEGARRHSRRPRRRGGPAFRGPPRHGAGQPPAVGRLGLSLSPACAAAPARAGR